MRTSALLKEKRSVAVSLLLLLVIGLSFVIIPHLPASAAQTAQTIDWRMFGFTPSHTHFNRYETTLSPANVSHLSKQWSTATLPGGVDGAPIVVNSVVYVGTTEYGLFAFNAATGATLWQQPFSSITSSPTLVNDVLYVNGGGLDALTPSTGKVLWSNLSVGGGASSPVVVNGILYIGTVSSSMVALYAKTGSLLWTASTFGAVDTSPTVSNGIVYVGSDSGSANNGIVYAFNATTGALVWSATTGGPVTSSPAVVNGILYAGSNDGALYAANSKTGALLWSYQTGSPIHSSPGVANGIVYIGSDDGNL